MKLCKDCKHIDPCGGGYDKCNRPNLEYEDAVTGKKGFLLTFCRIDRDCSWLDALLLRACGKSARYFEPK